jgi:hypothetical protein
LTHPSSGTPYCRPIASAKLFINEQKAAASLCMSMNTLAERAILVLAGA